MLWLLCFGYTAGSTELILPAGTWHGSHLKPGMPRTLQIQHGSRGKDGTGAIVWHAALILAEWLSDHPDLISGTSVLELGAGTGAVSTCAAGLGALRVTATDACEGLCMLATDNFELNAEAFPDAELAAIQYRWGETLPEGVRSNRWDWILGADITYSQRLHKVLCDSVHMLCAAGAASADGKVPRVLLSHTHRRGLGVPSLESFLECAAASGLTASVLKRVDRPPPPQLAAFYGKDEIVALSIVELGLE